ncbi:hypothetical protein L7F22_057617 [Adiantum nelumboides]|nr:hypothetical protein [Adiantum nelumboides]
MTAIQVANEPLEVRMSAQFIVLQQQIGTIQVEIQEQLSIMQTDLTTLQEKGTDLAAQQELLSQLSTFPNHIPNPEDKVAMAAIKKAVLDNKADLGIIFDTDVDRAAAVDSNGNEMNRNGLIALLAAIILAEHPGTTIVTDSVTSDGLTDFIENKLGGKHYRFKRGYRNVIDEGIRLNCVGQECHLAMETSGHGALKENRWLDDGAYLMVKLLIKMAAAKAAEEGKGGKVLTDLLKDLEEAEVSLEMRLKIDQKNPDLGAGHFKEYGEKVLKHLETLAGSDPHLKKAPVNYEGVRVSGYGGWFLLRLSLHDPVLPLNIEAMLWMFVAMTRKYWRRCRENWNES